MAHRKDPYSENRQRLVCLLFVLYEFGGGHRKREVIEYIQREYYLRIAPHDVEPYLAQIEPRWHADIAFRRKDGVEKELLFNQTHDSWELTRHGREVIEKVMWLFRDKHLDVRQCCLWMKGLKKRIDPDYVPSEQDVKRPKRLTRKELESFDPTDIV